MADPYFCELYIDTDENIDDLKRVVDALVREEFSDVSVSAPVYRNDNFIPSARARVPYRFIECSRYYAEVGTEKDDPRWLAPFQSGIVGLVKKLRKGGRFVTASCVFEDLIVAQTGWNWTREQPEPPGRKVQLE